MGNVVLVTGGARSGKSAWALAWAQRTAPAQPRVFIATACATDSDMEDRILNHQRERGPEWTTVEAGARVPAAIRDVPDAATVIVDCCTVWLGNVWHEKGGDEATLSAAASDLREAVAGWRQTRSGDLCLVTNEVGSGIVPCDAHVRRWRDWAGRMNQWVAQVADRVVLCVCGMPIEAKPVAADAGGATCEP